MQVDLFAFPREEMAGVSVYAFEKIHIMLRIIISLIFMSGWLFASGQRIQILDEDTREPLSFVTIQTTDQSWSGVSDERGNIDLPNLEPDAILEFRRIGYEPMQLTLDALRDTNFRVMLISTGIELNQVAGDVGGGEVW